MGNATAIKNRLQKAIQKEQLDDALKYYGQLEQLEPAEARWPHRRGDLLRRLGRVEGTVQAYRIAVQRYSDRGFAARAIALAKLISHIDPTQSDVIDNVSLEPARQLHRQHRPRAAAEPQPEGRFERAAVPIESTSADRPKRNRESIELDISDLELIPIEDLLEPEERESPSAEYLAQLPAMPLLAEAPDDALRKMISGSELVELQPGNMLIQQGDPSDSLFVITQGSAEVLIQGIAPIPVHEGDVVGESCMLSQARRSATIRCRTHLTALKIPRTLIDDLAIEHPRFRDILLELLSRRLVSNTIQRSPLFAAFSLDAKREVANLFEVCAAPNGSVVIEAGRPADGIYLLLAGSVTYVNAPIPIAPGEILGETSLLKNEPAKDQAHATADSLLLRLPRDLFMSIVVKHPSIRAALAVHHGS